MDILDTIEKFLLRDKTVKLPCFEQYKIAIIYGYRKANISAGTYTKYNKHYLPLKPINIKPLNYILKELELKKCYKCNNILPMYLFNSNSSRSDNKNIYCKNCHYNTTKKTQTARSSQYRAAKLQRIPKWVNKSELKLIYDNCPKGYHVDHIIPLQGKLVSGLHVPENLQYLPKKQNLSKSNKWDFRLIG